MRSIPIEPLRNTCKSDGPPVEALHGGAVTALTQTPDGYLWIGTDKGLFRFDGSSFRAFQRASPTTFPIGPVQALMMDPRGALWIILQSTQIVRYSNGNFELGHDEAEFGITSIAGFKDGTVVLSSLALGPLQYRANRYQVLTSSELPAETANEPRLLQTICPAASVRLPASRPIGLPSQTRRSIRWRKPQTEKYGWEHGIRGFSTSARAGSYPAGKNYPATKSTAYSPCRTGNYGSEPIAAWCNWARALPAAIPPPLRERPDPCHDPGS